MKDIFLYYLDGNTAIIGTMDDSPDAPNNFKVMLDNAMLCMIYYDRIPNKMRTGWDYLTTFSLQLLSGTKNPQRVAIPNTKCVIVRCTDERMVKVYEAALAAAEENQKNQTTAADQEAKATQVDYKNK